VTPDRPAEALQLAWAAVDLLQLPLLLALYTSFRLSRRLAAAWKGVAVGFGGYVAWVVLTARLVPSSPSGLVVLLFGLLLDPRRETPPERTWALGATVALALFWGVPVGVAWLFGGRARPPTAR
jgi:hypothetical protein